MHKFNDDPDTPTAVDLDSCYGSKRFLSAMEVGDRKIRTKIARVRMEEVRQQDGRTPKKFVLGFTNIDKEVVLNVTNKTTIVDALGKTPADWIGAEVGLLTEPTMMAGKPVKGLRLRVLNKPLRSKPGDAAPAPAPAPKPAPAPAGTAEAPWPEQPGDPGPDFVDFGEAAE